MVSAPGAGSSGMLVVHHPNGEEATVSNRFEDRSDGIMTNGVVRGASQLSSTPSTISLSPMR